MSARNRDQDGPALVNRERRPRPVNKTAANGLGNQTVRMDLDDTSAPNTIDHYTEIDREITLQIRKTSSTAEWNVFVHGPMIRHVLEHNTALRKGYISSLRIAAIYLSQAESVVSQLKMVDYTIVCTKLVAEVRDLLAD